MRSFFNIRTLAYVSYAVALGAIIALAAPRYARAYMYDIPSGVVIIALIAGFGAAVLPVALFLGRRGARLAAGPLVILGLAYTLFHIAAEVIPVPIGTPFSLLRDVSGVLAALWIVHRFTLKGLRQGTVETTVKVSPDLSRAFEDANFLTILRSALPQPKPEDHLGFANIPYVLYAIDARRTKSMRARSLFLALTVTFALLFAAALLGLGVTLIDDTILGRGRPIAALANDAHQIQQALKGSLSTSIAVPEIHNRLLEDHRELTDVPKSLVEQARWNVIEPAFARFLRSPSTDTLTALAAALDTQPSIEPSSQYGLIHARARAKSQDAVNTISALSNSLHSATGRLEQVINDAQRALDDKDARLAELIRRLGVGLVVATFFLAILRYLARLYTQNRDEVLWADAEELAVRRFTIAISCCEDSACVFG